MKVVLFFSLLCLALAPRLTVSTGEVEKIDDLGSDEVLAAARVVVSRLNEMSNSVYKTVLVDVIKGTEQVVAGYKYVLTVLVGRSIDCKKDEDSEDCHIDGTSLETWTATVVAHLWLSPQYEVTDLAKTEPPQEGENRHTSHKVGAPVPLEDLHDQYVTEAAQVAVTELNKMSNSLFKSVLVTVVDGTAQVRQWMHCIVTKGGFHRWWMGSGIL
jgi:hypothetical protein